MHGLARSRDGPRRFAGGGAHSARVNKGMSDWPGHGLGIEHLAFHCIRKAAVEPSKTMEVAIERSYVNESP